MDNGIPDDPMMSPALMAMTLLHEQYETAIAAGFTPSQAMEIVRETISNAGRVVRCSHCSGDY